MYPIRFEPIYRDYVWGGDRIARQFHREISLPRVAESWEISDREGAMSVVANGAFKGKTLHDLVVEFGEGLLGAGRKLDRFPLLLKILDAKENLSVQVHPDETTASLFKAEPKTEMWVMLDEGTVYAGLKKGTTEKDLEKAIRSKHVEELLEKLDLKRAEAVYIPGGRVHAICAGNLIYEIEENSDTTFRLYDWGRTSRPLHVKEGLAAIDWNDRANAKATPQHLSSDLHHQHIILLSTPYFVVDRINIFDQHHLAAIPKTFQIFFCMEGEGTLIGDGVREPLKPGMTYLIPAACKSIDIEGKCQVLRVRLP